MNRKITIVMHHYVRNKQESKGSRIGMYSISTEEFIKKLDDFMKHYEIISPECFLDSVKYGTALPQNAMLLTFDDGYIDHFDNVFPILMDKGLQAFFFPSAMPIMEGRLLNTNKLQILFDSCDKRCLYEAFLNQLKNTTPADKLDYFQGLIEDGSPVEIENALSSYMEWESPIGTSNKVIDAIFKEFVGASEKRFCSKFYMSISQLKYMKEKGMYIGCHGYRHCCLGQTKESFQYYEVQRSMKLIHEVNGCKKDWVMCYPYGSYNSSLITILQKLGCTAGLITGERISDLDTDAVYTLPRVDVSSLLLNQSSR